MVHNGAYGCIWVHQVESCRLIYVVHDRFRDCNGGVGYSIMSAFVLCAREGRRAMTRSTSWSTRHRMLHLGIGETDVWRETPPGFWHARQ